jgi:hypothetical protein
METGTFLEPTEPAHLIIQDSFRIDLLVTAKWARFLALTGFVIMALILVSAILVLFTVQTFNLFDEEETIGQHLYLWAGMINLVFLVIFFYPTYNLYRFSVCLSKALETNNSTMLGQAFRNQAALYKFYGMFTLVVIVLYGLAILIGSQIF